MSNVMDIKRTSAKQPKVKGTKAAQPPARKIPTRGRDRFKGTGR